MMAVCAVMCSSDDAVKEKVLEYLKKKERIAERAEKKRREREKERKGSEQSLEIVSRAGFRRGAYCMW